MEQDIDAAIIAGLNDNDIADMILVDILGEPANEGIQGEFIFNFDDITEEESKFYFRFTKDDIRQLTHMLQIPNEIRTRSRNKISGLSAFCVLLRRLSYPNRLKDLTPFFGLSSQSLSSIINYMAAFIFTNWGHLLSNLQNHLWLNRERMEIYAQSVQNEGGAIENCWGFIDGTVRPICRPSIDQENYYSGHKRIHCVKYQSILCPDGIIVHLSAAFPGRRHDAGIFRDSRIYEQLETAAIFDDGRRYVIYGDQAYGILDLVLSPFAGRPENLQPHQAAFNNSMKVLRTSVEWGFQKISSEFAFIDFRKNLKLLLQDVEALYAVAVIVTNCHTCLYGSQTAMFFDVQPPTLEQYLVN